MNTEKFTDTLNGRSLFADFGLVIQTGTAQLLELPERKEGLKNDWAEENGTEYDLSTVRFKDREVTLRCAIMADTDEDFWRAYQAFFSELAKPGWQRLRIADHTATYRVFYKKSGGAEKSAKRLKGVEKVFVKFDLVLQVDNVLETVEIWGKNLLPDSNLIADFIANDTGLLVQQSVIDLEGQCVYMASDRNKNVSAYGGRDLRNYTSPGETYTLSCEVHQRSGEDKIFTLQAYELAVKATPVPSGLWKRISVTFTAHPDTSRWCPIIIQCTHFDCEVRNWKLEKGTKTT